MNETKLKVAVSAAQDLIKSIRILALSGKRMFIRFLHDPLYDAGWTAAPHQQNVRKLMERINEEVKDPSFLHTVGPRCKRLISYSMTENLSLLGDSAIYFLEKMQLHPVISSSPESLEFADIIEGPIAEFRRISTERSEDLFKEAVAGIGAGELKNAMEPVRLDTFEEKVRLDGEIKKLYDNILVASKYDNLPKCRKLLADYIIRYCDDESYSKQDVEQLLGALGKREAAFESELNSTIAIELHYRITRGILNGDVGAAIRGIRKYAYIFEGSPAAKYHLDIDRLERILYKLITDKGLWDELKK